MNIKEQFGNFIKKDHLSGGKTLLLTIATVSMEDVGEDEKPVMYFNDHDKALPLNKTNADIIAESYGEETNAWEGKKIEIFLDPTVKYQGKKVGGVAVRIPS